jgi:hypothetical protein
MFSPLPPNAHCENVDRNWSILRRKVATLFQGLRPEKVASATLQKSEVEEVKKRELQTEVFRA